MMTMLITALTDLALPDLSDRCRTELERFRQGASHDERYALELFRRAVEERDERAWEIVCALYQDHMTAWCRRSGAAEDDLDALVNAAWAKFWHHYTAAKLWAAGTLAGVLAYLRLCARSVVLDDGRRRTPVLTLDAAGDEASAEPTPHDRCLEQEERETIWRMVARHLRDERERQLIVLIYQAGLRPAEVRARHPELFPNVADVYRLHRNILDRLRRDGELRACRDE